MTGLRLRIGILFTLLLVLHAGCDLLGTGDPRTEGPLLPLTVGNEWTLQVQEDTAQATERIRRSTTIEGRTYYVTEGVVLPETLRTDNRGRIYQVRSGTEQLWINPGVPDGQSYVADTFRFQDEEYMRQVKVKRDVRVETAAGTFETGVQFRFDYPGIADDTEWVTLVPGVGPVRWQTSWFGPFVLESFEATSP